MAQFKVLMHTNEEGLRLLEKKQTNFTHFYLNYVMKD